jgi:hypothetical protein
MYRTPETTALVTKLKETVSAAGRRAQQPQQAPRRNA